MKKGKYIYTLYKYIQFSEFIKQIILNLLPHSFNSEIWIFNLEKIGPNGIWRCVSVNVQINKFVKLFFSVGFLPKKLNSEHTVPTLDDKGSVIWDSHAICAYLVDKYAVNDSLYPKDLVLRAKCNQRLFFDAAILFQRMRAASYSVFKDRCSEISQDKIDAMYAAYDLLEAILIDDFLVGNSLTIADVCAMGSVTSMNLLYAPISPSKYPKISAWLERLKKQPFYVDVEQNGKYVVDYKQLVDQLKEANKSLAQQQTT